MQNSLPVRFALALLLATPAISFAADRVDQFIERINHGDATLQYSDDGWGYLSSLLAGLDIHKDSQVLVFSKTSFQQTKIGPKTPRALYFNDYVAVGVVQAGEVYEITSLDAKSGIVFYTLDVKRATRPKFQRESLQCTRCHNAVNTYATGLMVATVYPSVDGTPFISNSRTLFTTTDHRSPFDERWGGWYVSGTHGKMEHRGNAVALNPYQPFDLETTGTQNLTDLSKKFDVGKYFEPTSDLIALMTLEHQTKMTNLITSVNAQFGYARSNELPVAKTPTPAMLDAAIDEIVRYMLFADEAPLTSPVKGVSTFTNTFPKRGPRDAKGRSLRDFDLNTRLFRYPLSYMIYTEAFDEMDQAAKQRIYHRLHDVLTGKEVLPGARPGRLTTADRRAILEIVCATKSNLPADWSDRQQ